MNLTGIAQKLLDDWKSHEKWFIETWKEQGPNTPERCCRTLVDHGEPKDVVTELFHNMKASQSKLELPPPGARLCSWLYEAANVAQSKSDHQDIMEPVVGRLHCWPTGIYSVDAVTKTMKSPGGGYGQTVFGGTPKMGKSLAALGAGIEAANAGWRVIYVNAEMTPREMHERAANYVNAHDINPILLQERFHLLNVNPGCDIDYLNEKAKEYIDWSDMEVLVVLDSINRLAENDLKRGDYFEKLRRWQEWGRTASKLSEGLVSSLVVTELNQKMGVKGGALEYAAQLVVRFTPSDIGNEIVNIEVALSRSTPSGDVGLHQRVFDRSEFIPYAGGDQE